ncbi:trypsin-like peptidase domain-containing protein [Variovorax sp. LARHSF232]
MNKTPAARFVAVMAGAVCALVATGWCINAVAHEGPHGDAATTIDGRLRDAKQMDARAVLLQRAEAQLARGDAAAATETFERAAMMLHAPDTEMGLVRSYMQAGHYRRALAFCAHTAGVHREAPAAGALYAWLLRAGGQNAFAQRTLDDTLQRAPQDTVALQTRLAFAAALPVAGAPLLQTPHRMAPQPVMLGSQPEVAPGARVVASGVLIGNGTLALVPKAALGTTSPARLWVRNGLGQTTRAHLQPQAGPLDTPGVALLRLDTPLGPPPVAGALTPPREPFAGSPGFVIQYAADASAVPAWPWLSQGFFGAMPAQPDKPRPLGIDVAAGAYGGPVFDAQGRLAGMALPGPQGEALLLSAARWQSLAGAAPATPLQDDVASRPRGNVPADEIYESALRLALQVIVSP